MGDRGRCIGKYLSLVIHNSTSGMKSIRPSGISIMP